ncbi:hypothetical protein GM658_17545 [Pseudoduganella eburnea]|uniref:Uncharacterized protein n=1 Tax=Massilia eburnea TaxID=1776165 RepID=A0A6L6QJP9_9BURK|nr:hypothetical protein [Massilia eburnea]MTW12415.1 hypothetical protein [Massilia eburnea]
MKVQLLGAALLAATVAGCGGKAQFVVGGTLSGLSNQGLVLQLDGGNDLPVAAGATSFSFPNSISYGTEYNVSIKSQPAHMTCTVVNPTGSAGHTTVINVAISCSQNSYTLGGTIKNLTTDGLVIVNGANGSLTVAKGSPTFTMPGSLPVGTAYGLTVFTQPTGQSCTISNASGVMGDANVTSPVVDCTP